MNNTDCTIYNITPKNLIFKLYNSKLFKSLDLRVFSKIA